MQARQGVMRLGEALAGAMAELGIAGYGNATRLSMTELADINRREAVRMTVRDALRQWSRVPERFRGARLGRLSASELPINWRKSWYLSGHVGSGKTHAAYAIYHQWLSEYVHLSRLRGIHIWPRGVRIEYMPDLMNGLRAMVGNDQADLEGATQRLEECPRLILDDLGAGLQSEYADDILLRLLEARYNNGLYTGFTSNHKIGETGYNDRILSRIAGIVGSNKAELKGKDRRVG
ncbi:MAG: ATP-binding protein [Candidatus Marinimicrobia bacterium]|nr:ATP-binding protein [Candidatus Neomarinimicrobiota bacterium]